MEEAERLQELVEELGSGKPLPHPLDPTDAMVITTRLQEAVDEATTVRARQAKESGFKIACGPGCSYCCEQVVLVWLPEAHRVAEWLSRPEHAPTRQAFLEAYPRWRDEVGDAAERIADLIAGAKRAEGLAAHVELWRKRVMCAFNRDGLCSIYAARPNVCRQCHALDTSEHCKGDTSTKIPAQLKFEPLDKFIGYASDLNSAMHDALGGVRNRTVALCTAVYELLTQPA